MTVLIAPGRGRRLRTAPRLLQILSVLFSHGLLGASRRFGLLAQAGRILRRGQVNLPFIGNDFGTS